MGAGVDPHLYVASESDVERLANADLIFYNGHFLEAQMDDVLRQIGERKPVIAVSESIDPARLLPWALDADEYDPHIWFDVKLWSIAAEAVRYGLVELDPAHADAYTAMPNATSINCAGLMSTFRRRPTHWPPSSAFWSRHMMRSTTLAAPTALRCAVCKGLAPPPKQARPMCRIWLTLLLSSRSLRSSSNLRCRCAPSRRCKLPSGAKGAEVRIGGELFSDAMGSPGTPEGTYIGMVRHNIDTIVGALLGERRSRNETRDTRWGDDQGGKPVHLFPCLPVLSLPWHPDNLEQQDQTEQLAIEVTDLTVAYNEKPVLWDIDLTVPAGR